MATTVSSLEHKTNVEFSNLRLKLKNQLQQDICRLFSDAVFADVLINVDNEAIKLHRCILQTRVPAFYHTYCQKPDLVKVVPCHKLKIFFQDIYCDTEIQTKEQELLKCIESAFSAEKQINLEDSSDFEPSNYFSINDSFVSASTKLHLLKDISKSSTCVNYSYFCNSDNTVYYSLVDESLLLSDFSDFNEEAFKGMSSLDGVANSTFFEMNIPNQETEKTDNAAETICNDETPNYSAPTSRLERANADDFLPAVEHVESVEKTAARKFFSCDDDDKNSNVNQQGKICKFFIDASDLIDEETANDDKISLTAECIESQTFTSLSHEPVNGIESNIQVQNTTLSEKQTPDSLDDNPNASNEDEGRRPEIDLLNKFENDFLHASLVEQEPMISSCEMTQSRNNYADDELSVSSASTAAALSFSAFKIYLTEKYECAKKNHAYSDDELQRLKTFDELVLKDDTFTYLRCDLEEILVAGASKTRIAMHKFLVKQYEKHHHASTTYATVKALLIDILGHCGSGLEKKVDQTPDSLNSDERPLNTKRAKDDMADVDDLFKLLVKRSTSNAQQAQSPEATVEDRKEQPVTNNKSCGFFIDLTEASKPAPEAKKKSLPPSKQLFSMFIDFGNSTDSDSSMEVHNKFERRKKQYFSKLEKSRELRNSVTSTNDADPRRGEKSVQSASASASKESSGEPKTITVDDVSTTAAVVRRAKSSSTYAPTIRRSWNVDKTCEINQNVVATKHKRSYSVSARNEAAGNAAAYVLDVNLNREADDAAEFPSIGNADSTNELTVNGESELSNSHSCSEVGETRTSVINSISAKACVNGNDVAKADVAVAAAAATAPTTTAVAAETTTTATITTTTTTKSEDSCNKDKDKDKDKVFVKLSDMDKEPKTLSSADQWASVRMTKSAIGTETNWFETKLLNGSVNSRSLSRIFPDLSASVLSKPNSDMDDTTVSSMSSVQSSSAVSTCESNLELSNNASKSDNNTLGHDLLKMFLNEISTDVVVEVAGRRIKAHKCILTSRCQYFAALLSGGWVESAGNVLSIHGFSYNVVHFALCYIYSGESDIPENINVVELASLADYLCLEGLKEVVSCTLKTKYCHFFHKPCNICSVGVLECLPIAVNYGLDDIHRKSLRWITKHYVRLWCSKAFATLPRELVDKCYNQHVVNMTVNNVFETLTNCDKLFTFIPQTRWAEPCFAVTKKLHDCCIKYLANHFVEFLKSDAFMSIATNRTWGIIIMDEKTQLVCSKMRSDQLCQSYAYLSAECKLATATHENEELIELLNRVKHHIEATLVKIALQACQCNAWFQMDAELRSHIQTSAGLTFVPSEVKRRVDAFKSRPSSRPSGTRGVDLQQVKTVINRQHKQTNSVRAHEVRSTKQSANQKANVHGRSTSAKQSNSQNKENKASKGSAHANSKSPFRNKYANVKSRYMEHKIGGKNERATASETTPSETSEAEKRPPAGAHKRPSKSLASSVHLSPGCLSIRQTARAASLSKIPVSVRNSSQKRAESDRDTTSGSDNGLRSERGAATSSSSGAANGIAGDVDGHQHHRHHSSRANRRLTSSQHSTSGATRSANVAHSSRTSAAMRKSYSAVEADSRPSRLTRTSSTAAVTNGSTANPTSRHKSMTNTDAAPKRENGVSAGRRRNHVVKQSQAVPAASAPVRSKDGSPDTKRPSNPSSSKTSVSEEIPRPDVPFRRDGTFCIDEPTVLKKHSPGAEQQAQVV